MCLASTRRVSVSCAASGRVSSPGSTSYGAPAGPQRALEAGTGARHPKRQHVGRYPMSDPPGTVGGLEDQPRTGTRGQGDRGPQPLVNNPRPDASADGSFDGCAADGGNRTGDALQDSGIYPDLSDLVQLLRALHTQQGPPDRAWPSVADRVDYLFAACGPGATATPSWWCWSHPSYSTADDGWPCGWPRNRRRRSCSMATSRR